MQKDPFLIFLSDLSKKIALEKEHKQIMEKIDSTETTEPLSESPLEGFISTLKEKLINTVPEPIIVNEEVTKQESVEDIIKRDLEDVIIETTEEKENPFTSFVNRLKDIIEKGPTTETASTSSVPVKSEQQQIPVINSTKVEKKDKSLEPTNPNEYVNELEKIKNSIAIEKEDEKVVEIKKLIEEYAEKYIKKAVGMIGESGGGTNAVQYANGGTMNGDLNVNGSYLSGGVNLLDIFALQPDLDNQTLSFNESNAQLSISNGNTVSLSSLNDKKFISSNFVHLSGDTMTGALSAPALSADTVTAGVFYGFSGSNSEYSAGGGGGYIDLRGGNADGYLGGGNGGNIILRGGGDGGAAGAPAGGINLSGGNDECGGGSIISTGGAGFGSLGGTLDMSAGIDSEGSGGNITTKGVEKNGGGSINTSGGQEGAGGSINTSNGGGYINTSNDGGEGGGYIDTSSHTSEGPGGYINTSGGGGLIDTRNKGQIQFGYNSMRTTLSGSATQNRTVYLPDGTGTLLLSSPYIVYNNQNTTFEQNVTIQGNLTALGTSTFQNTIFTTTSALSVVNLGPGPALYVYQASGPSDVASFYDGDGVEVLHVGNAQGGGNPLGQVGINTSFPAAELTVNGAISSNGVITVLGGNSNQWNSAYTNISTLSAPQLPVPKIILGEISSIQYLSGYSDNFRGINTLRLAGVMYLHKSPRAIVNDITLETLNSYQIFIEMVQFRKTRKSKNGWKAAYKVPIDSRPDLKPWGTNFWQRSGSEPQYNPLPGGFVPHVPLVLRHNQLPVTSPMQVIDLSPCLNGRFREADIEYSSDPTQNAFNANIKAIAPFMLLRKGNSARLGYSNKYQAMYVAFRYIAWLPNSNNGRGEIVSGPLSPTIRISNLIWPFQTNHYASSVARRPIVNFKYKNDMASWSNAKTFFNCNFV